MKKRRILTSLFAIVLVLAQLMAVCAMPVSALAEKYGAYKETMPSASTDGSQIVFGDVNDDGLINSTDIPENLGLSDYTILYIHPDVRKR